MPDDIILLAHGAGGGKSAELVREVFLAHFANTALAQLGDAAVLEAGGRLAFTTDAFVVAPLFFPGGDIGKLAVCGTVNDLAAMGATPVALSAAFILEEGLELDILRRVVESMARAAREAGVPIVAGDTKVVPRGSADKLFITTSGIGLLPTGRPLPAPERAAAGDAVLVTGTLADHGMAVMIHREGLDFTSEIRSDCAPLAGLVAALLDAVPDVHCLRDPTRGGLAAVLNELAASSGACIEIDEEHIPVSPDVRVACELLGIDPLHVANEGKMVAILPAEHAESALAALRSHPHGRHAAVIGRVQHAPAARVHLRTPLGTLRILDVPAGDLLPRIC
ncbi:MAG: hydrogenase expression/formation protein HypE [Armatimonadota bacterium]